MNIPAPADERIIRRVVENLQCAVLLFDRSLTLTYMNPAAEELFETSARNMIGRAAGEMIYCPETDVVGAIRKAGQRGRPFTERSMVLPLSGRRAVTVDCTVTPLADDGAVLIELVRLDRHQRISRENHLLQQSAAARDLLRGLAHEIKNPLGGLRGAAQLLQSELDDPGLSEYTQVIVDEADRLRDLVDRMVGPSRPMRNAALNIHRVLERVRGLVAVDAPAGVEIHTDYDPSLPELSGDENQLIQVFLNLALNAAQALTRGGRILLRTRIEHNFTIGTRRRRHVVRADVIDDGPGIPPELAERIFLPMVTGRPEGTGLGLSIAQSLVLAHGGLIECASEPGHTEFNVYLPVEERR
ncbi:MAG: nitrogen regulation protein NR(II) [Chromatiales bacterium]|nr:nitrogen regulation protein NR(II) [Chromatiales bacterium]